jgi:DNA-binding NarL/FixJ family response regulator
MARILVADCSDPDFTVALANVLALKGFGTVGTATGDADAVWRKLRADHPDLLLIDKKNAAEILLRLQDWPASPVRVLVIDSSRNGSDIIPGAHGYIRSPAPPSTYVQAVRDALR